MHMALLDQKVKADTKAYMDIQLQYHKGVIRIAAVIIAALIYNYVKHCGVLMNVTKRSGNTLAHYSVW